MSRGYFRFPAVFGDMVVFTSEDDLWQAPLSGGAARRLTAGRGAFSSPCFSPDGKRLAFASAEEGHQEVYVMPSEGGDLTRLTYLGSASVPCGWLDPGTVLFRSYAFQPLHAFSLCAVAAEGGLPRPLHLGPSSSLVLSEKGEAVLARTPQTEPAHWKRYRGGRAGKFWIAPAWDGEYKPLLQLDGNLAWPMWAGGRVYFVSDHEGTGRLYSCTAAGGDLRFEAAHDEFYTRNPATDGKTVVYHAGGDLYAFDIASKEARKIEIAYQSQRTQRQRRYVQAQKYLATADLDPKGERAVYSVRGQIHHMRHWDGPVAAHCVPATRLRLARFLSDGKRVLCVADREQGDEALEIWDSEDYSTTPVCVSGDFGADGLGRFTRLETAPKGDFAAFANHRQELWLLNLATGQSRKLAADPYRSVGAFNFSPDGRWLAFSQSLNIEQSAIFIANVESGEIRAVTEPLFADWSPSFDPEGRYLYFLSHRRLNPVYDSLQIELSFQKTALPCLVTLQKDTPSPFLEAAADGNENGADKDATVNIDFDGIASRIVAFPVSEGSYVALAGLKKKVLWLSYPVKGALSDTPPHSEGTLEAFDFKKLKTDHLGGGISNFRLTADRKQMLLFVGGRVRVLKAGEKLEEEGNKTRNGGWIDLGRLKVLIEPEAEWKQMLHEAWRLQRDHFWRADMSRVNWKGALLRYAPLVSRVNCRSEFSDLLLEMQGELDTSHAYDRGGDYRENAGYPVGFLGADLAWDEASSGYRIDRFLRGDAWKPGEACPLRAPGVQLEAGDVIMAVNGRKLTGELTPHQALMHQAGAEVYLTVKAKAEDAERRVRVRTLRSEASARYRDWVEMNRHRVREATGGRAGYIHIPDMMAAGFAEFHRHFLRDYDCDGLIVDVRYNTGGHISQLLLEKLCRSRIGAGFSRWSKQAQPFPVESPAGPMVALTNEFAASDGDIFSHTFKMRKAGPLIGRRTWGGVIGYTHRHSLVDGGRSTQPEFPVWFADVGWAVENYGTDPDIDVDNAPHDYRQGRDSQLERGIEELLKLFETSPPFRPAPDDDSRDVRVFSESPEA